MPETTVGQRLRVLLIIHAALMMGVVIFALIVLMMQRPPTLAGNQLLMMRIACGATLAMAVVVATVVRRAIVQRLASRDRMPGETELLQAFAGYSIMKAAFAEGAALFGTVIFMMSSDNRDLILIVASLIVLASMIPSPNKWASFVVAVEAQRGRNPM
jgi:hypothetical protein